MAHKDWGLLKSKFMHKKSDLGRRQLLFKEMVRYFGHVQNHEKKTTRVLWSVYLYEITNLWHELFYSPLPKILRETTVRPLLDFSFSSAEEFRKFEEGKFKDLEIPKKVWDRFWLICDVFKEDFLKRILKEKSFLFNWRSLKTDYKEFSDPGELKPMSPFNWGRTIAGTLAAIVTTADAIALPVTVGASAASFIPAFVTGGIVIGMKDGGEDPKSILDRRLASGEISKTEYKMILKTIRNR